MENRNDYAGEMITDERNVEVESSEKFSDTMILDNSEAATEFSDNVGMISVQFNAEDIISEVESEGANGGMNENGRLRKRLDALVERKRRAEELADFEDYDIDG